MGLADRYTRNGRLTSKQADPENDVPQYFSSLDGGNTSNSNQRNLEHLEHEHIEPTLPSGDGIECVTLCSVPNLLSDDSHDEFVNARRKQKGEESGGAFSHTLITKGRGVNMFKQEDVHGWINIIGAGIENTRVIYERLFHFRANWSQLVEFHQSS